MLLKQIRNCETLHELNALREPITMVAMQGNVKLFKTLQCEFLKKKNEIIMRYEG